MLFEFVLLLGIVVLLKDGVVIRLRYGAAVPCSTVTHQVPARYLVQVGTAQLYHGTLPPPGVVGKTR